MLRSSAHAVTGSAEQGFLASHAANGLKGRSIYVEANHYVPLWACAA